MTGRRQRWYKSIYPGVDAYSTHKGLTWRARGWNEGVRFLIGTFQDELDAARASQQWLTETVAKVALRLSRLTNLLSRDLTSNLSAVPSGYPEEHPPLKKHAEAAQARELEEPEKTSVHRTRREQQKSSFKLSKWRQRHHLPAATAAQFFPQQ
jgi:hypothetical protein